MKRHGRSNLPAYRRLAFVATMLVVGGIQNAVAGGVASGTSIDNLATLNFSVGGVAQPAVGSSPTGNTVGAGTPTTFVVDKKVDLVVVEGNTTFTGVTPGATTQVTTFTVTNLGNDVQDYSLTAANLASGTTLFTGTDNFDVTGVVAYVESGATPGYQPAQDTAVFIDELAPDASRTVYVVATVPLGRINGDQAVVGLTATTLSGGALNTQGSTLTATVGANTAGVDTVFADGAGATDAARDGAFSALDAYRVLNSVLTISKTAQIVCDPVNSVTNPKNIPGTVVRWTVTITNTAGAGASASLASVIDALNANTTFESNLITGAGGAAACASGTGTPEFAAGSGFKLDVLGDTRPGAYPKFFTTVGDADGANHSAGTVTINYATAMPAEGTYTAGELKPGETVVVYFNVVIN
jgi:hypothetical protein